MTNSEKPTLTSNERCINWPCQLPRAHSGPCSTEGKQSQRVSDVCLRQLLRMGACLSNEAVDDMRLAIGELLERRSHETRAWRSLKDEPIPAEAFAFKLGDWWIELPPHPSGIAGQPAQKALPVDDLLCRIHRELARGHSSAALAVVAAALEQRALPVCSACDVVTLTQNAQSEGE